MWLNFALLACSSGEQVDPRDSAPVEDVVQDLRMDFPDPPEGGMQFLSPDLEVPPYSEVLFCYYGIWEGEDTGVNYMLPLSVPGFTHHNQLKAVYDDRYPPGSLVQCPDPGGSMPVYAPLFEAVGIESEGAVALPEQSWLQLPEGVAMKLRHGQRWVMDLHYVNTTGDTLKVNAAVNLGTLPIDQVEHWAASIQFDSGELHIPPGQETVVDFNCVWPQDVTLLSLLGHMHDHGSSYEIYWNKPDGSSELLYNVPDWEPGHREWPMMKSYDPGEVQVRAGDGFRTICKWDNDSPVELGYPEEMCTTVGVAYPLEDPIGCFGGVVVQP
ncbi:MAG TPA: hypothetical protein PKY30_07970 [Myxococcota bacterium]|nr:hypothetical protein [Myxococcota bacterium]